MKIHRIYFFIVLILLPILFLTCSLSEPSNEGKNHSEIKGEKQKGGHIFGYDDTVNVQYCLEQNYNYITRVSWAYQADFNSSYLDHHFGDSLKVRRRDSTWVANMKWIRSFGFKTCIKPHVWLHAPTDDKWRSDIFPDNDEDWEVWKECYRQLILRNARVAEKAEVDMLCIGTELTRLTLEKPEYWRALIKEVREIYSGKLTYAANWYKEFEEITFWDDLDFIGIQAYFPLVDIEYPSVEELSAGWTNYLPQIEAVANRFNKKVLFTEMGYKSVPNAAIKPWEWIEKTKEEQQYSEETQANCYQAFFKTVWDKEWFAGVHIWQLNSNYKVKDENLDFYPQGKLAEKIIAEGFE